MANEYIPLSLYLINYLQIHQTIKVILINIVLIQAETIQMGVACCKTTDDKIFQSDGKPIVQHYQESAWPQDDPYVLKQLQNSKIVDINNSSQKPLKHKAYPQWYLGDWTDGRPKGKGAFYNRTGKKNIYYEGDFDGEPNGRGRVIYNQGEYEYDGDIRDSRATGYGVYRNNKQGYQYEGLWKDSKMQKGKLIIKNDRKSGVVDSLLGHREYQGDVIVQIDEDLKDNIVRYPDGRVYVGQIDKNKFGPHGLGKVTFPNGNEYEGEWKDGEMHGQGIFRWKDGSAYNGQYKNGKKHGKGTFYFPNGNRYEGYWEKGHQDGKGVVFSKEGSQIQSGKWKKGEFVGEKKSLF